MVEGAQNSYEVERSFPPYFLEHRRYACESGVEQIKDRPIWLLRNPGGWSVNSIVIEGDDGLIVYDTGVCHEQGVAIAAAIGEISEKPIRAIVYSHHHVDHCQGTDALITPEQAESGDVEVIAWASFSKEHADENRVVGPIMGMRAVFMYGAVLGPDEKAYTGLGERFVGGTIGRFIPPNRLIDAEAEFEVAGVRMRLFPTGGEAASEIGLHLPDMATIIVADEVYASLANLYTLRGAKFRDAIRWARASDRILERDLGIDVLLGCHMPPIVGEDKIRDVLTTYRDSIHFNHDQAVRHILSGATPDDLREELRELPPYLDIAPFTRPMYGHVAANAAQQFTGYLGWFDGDATNLLPTPRAERARRLVELAGGIERVREVAAAALAEDDPQWAAELAALLVALDAGDMDARRLKAAALRTLGYRTLNATWRNWYLTGALELEGGLDMTVVGNLVRAGMLGASVGAAGLLDALRFTVDPERAGSSHLTIGVAITDTDEEFTLELRNSVLNVREAAGAEVSSRLVSSVESLAKLVSGADSLQNLRDASDIDIDGPDDDVVAVFAALETSPVARGFHVR